MITQVALIVSACRRNRLLLYFPALLFPLAASGCTAPNEYQPPAPPEVTVANPLVQTVTSYLEETGTTQPVGLVEIRARVDGLIEEIEFKTEDDVTAGDTLYLIERETYEAAVLKAKADVAVAQSEYLNADARYKAAVPLVEKGVVSREELDQRKAERSVAQATVYATQADLKKAEIDLKYCTVTTPISGRVGKTLVEKGNLVSGIEGTHLTTVINYDKIYATFYISERVFQQVTEEARHRDADGEVDKTSVKMYLSRFIDGDKFPFEGHLDYWDLAVEEATGTYALRGIFDNPDRRLAPGMTVTIRVPGQPLEDALLVPQSSIGTDQTGRYVLVVDAENKVKRKAVTPGERFGGMQVIAEGLAADDRVVINGLQRARLDAKVTPVVKDLLPLKSDGVQWIDGEIQITQSPKGTEPTVGESGRDGQGDGAEEQEGATE